MAAGRLPGGDRNLAPPCQPPSVPGHARGRDRTRDSYGQIIVRSLRAQDKCSVFDLNAQVESTTVARETRGGLVLLLPVFPAPPWFVIPEYPSEIRFK